MSCQEDLRILLLSAYDAASHRYWLRGLQRAFPQHDWQVLVLPARHFNWRIRGNPLSWLHMAPEALTESYDLIIATSMVDLATLKGLVPSLAATPSICYFHENQFAYPCAAQQTGQVEAQMVNLYAALAADRVVFNTAFNRDSFLSGVDQLFKRLPDQRPSSIRPWLEGRIEVLPVPLDDELVSHVRQPSELFTLCWNHRWEYDKGPERLELTLEKLTQQQIPFQLHLLGEQFRQQPRAMVRIQQRFAGYLGQVGFVSSVDEYRRLLAQSHVVLSNSLHEFQGLAVMEACALGALPRVPDRLSYSELFPDCCRYGVDDDPQREAALLAAKITDDYRLFAAGQLSTPPDMTGFTWQRQKPAYAKLIETTAGRGHSR